MTPNDSEHAFEKVDDQLISAELISAIYINSTA